MKRILTTLVCLLLATVASAADFQAVAGGSWHATNTWGGVTIPGASDNVDLNGQAVTMTGTVTCASLVDVATGGSLDFGENASFTCRAVTNAPLTTSAAGVTVDCDVTLTLSDAYGFTINAGGEATIAGTWNASAPSYGCIYNAGTVVNFSGTASPFMYNSPDGIWIDFSGTLNGVAYSDGTWTDFSGTLNYSGAGGAGADNYGTWTDFSGTLNNSGTGKGAFNWETATWTDFSGVLNNTGDGIGLQNSSAWTDFSGTLNHSGTGYGIYFDGTMDAFSGTGLAFGSGPLYYQYFYVNAFTGIVGRPSSQTDLTEENIKQGKTILGTTGTLTAGGSGYGINGTGLLGAGW